jgi:hypothetical protein
MIPMEKEKKLQEGTQKVKDNYSNQLNPNHDSYWQSRGFKKKPENWLELIKID